MELNGFSRIAYVICKYIMNFAYINFLWILFTLCGIVLFGFFPATAAMFAVTRKMIMEGKEIPIFRTFFNAFKTAFWKINGLGLIILVIGCILYFDFTIFLHQEAFIYKIHRIGLLFIALIYISYCLYFFPVFSHYKLHFFQYVKRTLLVIFLAPLSILGMLLATIVHLFLMMKIPGLIPFFGVSILCYAWMWIAYKSFLHLQENKKIMIKSESN